MAREHEDTAKGGVRPTNDASAPAAPVTAPARAAPSTGAPVLPSITVPKGGGAIRGMGEKFAANPVTGTGSMTVPIRTSPGRSGFGPQLSLSYDSGAGNGPFGFGWSLSLPSITRKTGKGLPSYDDAVESDEYILSGAEDLVPVLKDDGQRWSDEVDGFRVHRYRPRIEGLFARIERWTHLATGEIHWRSISKENVTTLYGRDNSSRVFDPDDPAPDRPTRIFSWLIRASWDDRGNAIVYEYAAENDAGVDLAQANERNRVRKSGRYLKRIRYGNRKPNRDAEWGATEPTALADDDWLFDVVFDYGEGHYEELRLDAARPEAEQYRFVRASWAAPIDGAWGVRPDPFSSYRSGFEIRTYRRCRRVLMFHRFREFGDEPRLVRSTAFEYDDFPYDAERPQADAELSHRGSTRFASFITRVVQSGYVRSETPAWERSGVRFYTYLRSSLPPLAFEYSQARIRDEVLGLDSACAENLPAGVDGSTYQWIDLDGEGVSGIVTEQAGATFYKPNLGEGRFGPLQIVRSRPSIFPPGSAGTQLLDLSGDGQLDVVSFAGPVPGFYERTRDERWESFRSFRQLPQVRWDDPNLRFVDLDGDGHADVLITEDDAFTWYPSLGEDGFGPARRVRPAARRGARATPRLRRRHAVHLPRRHVGRRPDRPRAHPQRRGLLLAQPRLRPLRRQGDDGRRALVRRAGPVRPAAHPARRHRRLGHDRHHLPRRATACGSTSTSRATAGAPPRRLPVFPQVDDVSSIVVAPTCSATAPPASSGRRLSPATRGARCATST